jgi:hypothetical protein
VVDPKLEAVRAGAVAALVGLLRAGAGPGCVLEACEALYVLTGCQAGKDAALAAGARDALQVRQAAGSSSLVGCSWHTIQAYGMVCQNMISFVQAKYWLAAYTYCVKNFRLFQSCTSDMYRTWHVAAHACLESGVDARQEPTSSRRLVYFPEAKVLLACNRLKGYWHACPMPARF